MSIFAYYAGFVLGKVKLHKTSQEDFLHGPIGVAKEAGEMLDNAYRHWNYNKPLEDCKENVLEESGDVLFYVQVYLGQVGLTLEDAIQHNIKKLDTRYPDGYSDAAALARADKPAGE